VSCCRWKVFIFSPPKCGHYAFNKKAEIEQAVAIRTLIRTHSGARIDSVVNRVGMLESTGR
jgi:hypothetical protein